MTASVADASHSAQRVALRNGDLVRHVIVHLMSTMADWAVFIGVLVYAFEAGGARATGFASIALLVPYIAAASFTGSLAERLPPGRVRLGGLVGQVGGYGVAALAVAIDAGWPVVIAASMIGVGAVTTLRTSGAVILPAIVRSTRELTVGNLWTGYAESVGVLLGPLMAAGLLAIGGPAAVLAGCAGMAAMGVAMTVLPHLVDPPGGGAAVDRSRGSVRSILHNVHGLRSRPGVLGVLFVAGAQFFVIGALDIIVVIAAEERLDLGDSGPGLLLTAVGIGAIAGGLVTTFLVRLERLAPVLVGAMLLVAAFAVALGPNITVVAAFILLPLIGISQSVIDLVADVLLHRSAPPETLASVYAVREIAVGIGLILGSIGAQSLLAIGGVEAALYGTGGFFVVLVVLTLRSMRLADASATVPVVSMSVIRRLPVFSSLPVAELETLSRAAEEVRTEPGEQIVVEGDVGDRYYAVMSGTFQVTIGDVPVYLAERGQGFGEVALLASVPRTATVTSTGDGLLLAIDRTPFLIAVTGHDSTRQAAWGVVRSRATDDVVTDASWGAIDPPTTETDGITT
jgi:MFS family permease